MISYKVKGIILVVLLALASIMMPFSVYAEAVLGDSPIIGVNIKYRDYDIDHEPYQLSASLEMPSRWQCLSSHSTMGCQVWSSQDTSGTIQDEITGYINVSNGSYTDILYEYEFILDKSYVGYVDFSSAIGVTAYNRYYVNGTSFTVTSKQLITSFTVSRYSLEYAPMEVIDQMRVYNFPFESLTFIMPFLMNNQTPLDLYMYSNYSYPVFSISTGYELFRSYKGNGQDKFIVIFAINKNIYTNSTFNDNFSFSNATLDSIENIYEVNYGNDVFRIIKCTFTYSAWTRKDFVFTNNSGFTDVKIIPIYQNISSFKNLTTDFSLLWGLPNQLLEDLHLIANGTTSSNSAASDLDDASSDYSSIADDVVSVENGLTTNFETEVNKIDLNTGLNVFGGHFLTSATWVRTQFDRLTENTPYGSMVVYGLTLGFVLLMLGKVFL